MSDLDDLLAGLDAAIQDGLDDAAAAALEVARSRVTGALASDLKVTRPSTTERAITSSKSYAMFVENGRPGFGARGGGVLHFVVNGRDVFTRHVGPVKPRPFIAPATNYLKQMAGAYVDRAISKVLR